MIARKNIKILKDIFLVVIIMLILFIAINLSYAHPVLSTEFYGTVKNYNANASSGTITAYVNNTLCGSFTIVNPGFYGVLSCRGYDTDNSNISGGHDFENITFRYNNNPVTVLGDATFNSGQFKFVNISFPKVFCGDSFCDALEDCTSCELDCGSCDFNGNTTQNTTNNSTNSSSNQTSSGGGSGGSGGSDGSGGSGGDSDYLSDFYDLDYFCNEYWVCFNWSECSILGIRNRTCVDNNNCGSYNDKPKEVEECVYLGSCFDNLINCHDGLCEEGVDCGGPCDKICSKIEQPSSNLTLSIPRLEFPKSICEKHINIYDPALWFFIIIILLAIIIRLVFTKYSIGLLRKDEKITPLNKSKKIISMRRKTLLFTITLITLTLLSLLYSYYFLLCPSDFFSYSWILFLLLLLVPLIIHAVMRKFEYSETKHFNKSKKLDDIHYQNLVKMIELENVMLAEEENSIANKLYELSKKSEFKELLDRDGNIKEIYKNLVKLYNEYKDHKNPFNIEKNICDEIDALDFDVAFKSAIVKHPELQNVFDRLKKLYIHYGEKQKMYDKLDELEQQSESKENKESKKKDNN